MATKKTAAAAPAPAAPAPAPKDQAKPITILKADPALRGSRADRWPLVAAAKDTVELRKALVDAGFDYAGTVRWLTKAELVRIG